jgi:hypothetical protein
MTSDHLGPADAPERFSLLRQLGRGSTGVVYEAHDQVTGHRVALKTLVRGEAQFLADLKREFRLVQSVHHPNLVRLDGLFQGAGTWFLTMELLDGGDYLTWLRGAPDDGDLGAPRERARGAALDEAPTVETTEELPATAAAPAGTAAPAATDRKSTCLNSSHNPASRMPSSA